MYQFPINNSKSNIILTVYFILSIQLYYSMQFIQNIRKICTHKILKHCVSFY